MRKIVLCVALLLFTVGIASAENTSLASDGNSFIDSRDLQVLTTTKNLSGQRFAFSPNLGQWNDSVLYHASVDGAGVWFLATGTRFELAGRKLSATVDKNVTARAADQSWQCDVAGTKLLGANPEAKVHGEHPLDYYTNYFLGRDSSRWKTNVPSYSEIQYDNIYDGIDLVYHAGSGKLEYDFAVTPQGRLDDIRIAYEGISKLEKNADGSLLASLRNGRVIEQSPYVYQLINGERRQLAAKFVLHEDNSFGFELLESPLAGFAMIVDPVLSFGSDFGGNDDDDVSGMVIDAAGAIYLSGFTMSTNFPRINAVDTALNVGVTDAFVSKIIPGNSAPTFSTFLGGTKGELCWDIALDGSNNPVIVGSTFSQDYPLAGTPIKSTLATLDQDIFVAKIGTNGSSLIFSTYLGGSGFDYGLGVAVNSSNQVVVVGGTSSSAYPMQVSPFGGSAFMDNTYVAGEAILTRISATGSSILYSTFIGGGASDEITDITYDALGNYHLLGSTTSSNFPTLAAYDATLGGASDFVVLELTSSDVLLYSTYLGGTGSEWTNTGSGGTIGPGLATDAAGATYIAGASYSTDYPLANQYSSQTSPNGTGVITKLLPNGSGLAYSTRLGPSYTELHAIKVDDSGRAYVVGESRDNFPMTYYAYDNVYIGNPSTDVVMAVMSPAGNELRYSTYLGGSNSDYGSDIALGPGYTVYVAGSTFAETGWPYVNRLGAAYQGASGVSVSDAVMAKFDDPVSYVPVNTNTGSNASVSLPYNWSAIFSNCTGTGTTRIIPSPTGPPVPAGFTIMPSTPPTYYNISTTATFTGNIFVCYMYDQAQVVGSEASIKMMHYNGSAWVDVTVFKDTTTNQICGQVTSLSPFVVGSQGVVSCCHGKVGNVDCDVDEHVDISDLITLVDNLFISFTPLCCKEEANCDGTGIVDLGDLTTLVDNLFITFTPLPSCQ